MKTTVADVCQYLESIAPLGLQESYDNAGLIAGEKDWEVTGVLCSLDATAEVVLEAVERGCNLVVAHHPIVFRGLKQINRSHYVGRAVVEAIKNDVAIYAVHTNLDNVLDNGVNREIATRLGLTDLTILAPRPENAATGSGLLGYLPEAMSKGDFLRKVKNEMQAGCIRHSAFSGKNIQRVAVCGGSGSFLIHHALDAGAEAFVTSDVKYHEFFEADGRLLYMDIGHYESEQYTISLLERLISGKFLNFAAYCTKRNTNPVHYY